MSYFTVDGYHEYPHELDAISHRKPSTLSPCKAAGHISEWHRRRGRFTLYAAGQPTRAIRPNLPLDCFLAWVSYAAANGLSAWPEVESLLFVFMRGISRILVDRLWPRGLTKEKAKVDLWLKKIAPRTELRKWFGHDQSRWDEFEDRYLAKLKDNYEQIQLLRATDRNIYQNRGN